MKRLNIFQIDAFTDKPFEGNPAAVIKTDDLSDSEMHQIASEMNLSETAFISSSEIADYRLRWMTPSVEVDLCGHATIASLHFLKETGELKENSAVRFETRSGIIKCCTEKDFYYMEIPPFTFSVSNQDSELLELLSISEEDITGDIFLLNTGYLYIQVKTLSILKAVKPDFSKLKLYLVEREPKAVVVFTLETIDPESSAHLRFFDPAEGINEDPVTGSANGPLIKILTETGQLNKSTDSVQLEQGDFLEDREG
jgi:trans-2,3-dihydro-3-hydroxyanthranilate isomerase